MYKEQEKGDWLYLYISKYRKYPFFPCMFQSWLPNSVYVEDAASSGILEFLKGQIMHKIFNPWNMSTGR